MEDFASRKITRQLVTRGLGLPYGRICCRQPLRHIRRSTMLSTATKRPKIKVCFTSKSIKVLTTAPVEVVLRPGRSGGPSLGMLALSVALVPSRRRLSGSPRRGCNLARLRAGHTPLLKAYAHLLDPAADPTCPLCKEEPQTLEHWLQRCPNLDGLRQHTFGSPSPPLGVLTTDPETVLALAWATF